MLFNNRYPIRTRRTAGPTLENMAEVIADTHSKTQLPRYLIESGLPDSRGYGTKRENPSETEAYGGTAATSTRCGAS